MGQLMQGLHLGRRHELRFVHQDAGDPGRAGGFGTEVGRVVKGRRLTLGAETGRDEALAEAVVHACGVNQDAVPALLVVVRHLQQGR